MRLLCLLVLFIVPAHARYYFDKDYVRNFLSRKRYNGYKRSYYDDSEDSKYEQQHYSRSREAHDDNANSSRNRLLNLLSDIMEHSNTNNVIENQPQIKKHNLQMPGVAPKKVR